jgi:hypothetical protein
LECARGREELELIACDDKHQLITSQQRERSSEGFCPLRHVASARFVVASVLAEAMALDLACVGPTLVVDVLGLLNWVFVGKNDARLGPSTRGMTVELSGLLIFMILLAGKESSFRVCLGPLLEISSSDALSEVSVISRFRRNRRRVIVIGLVVDVSDTLAWSSTPVQCGADLLVTL